MEGLLKRLMLRRALRAASRRRPPGGRPRIFILPTTKLTVEWAKASNGTFCFITDYPEIFQCRRVTCINPSRAIRMSQGALCGDLVTFPDQYLAPHLSPFMPSHCDEFHSAVELVLSSALDAILVPWWPSKASTEATEPKEIVQMIREYYAHASKLGDDWLLREHQISRQRAQRTTRLSSKVCHLASSVLAKGLQSGDLGMVDDIWPRLATFGSQEK